MIHESAIISKKAEIPSDIQIGVNCIIGDNVKIGKKCILHDNVRIVGNTSIGNGNIFFSNSVIGEVPQDKKYSGEETFLIIGDNNTFREFVTINSGTLTGGGKTVIGSENWIMAYVHIAHDCKVGNNTIFANNTTLGGHVEVGDNVIFGGFSGAHQFCKIGAHSFLGMYSGVARDLPPYVIVMGQPAEPRGINLEGLKRRDFSKDQIRNIKSAYKALYMSDLRLEEAIKAIQDLGDINGELNILVDFLNNTTRGIVRKG